MESRTQAAPVSKKVLWTGRIFSALPVLMLVFSAVMKFVQPPELAQGFAHLGYPVSLALGLGIVELACAILYAIPRTSVLGAILVTGYLGGATATHIRIGDPIANVITPIVLGVLAWGGLYLRDTRLRALLPLRS
jgi:hypothetical protein